MWMLGFIPLKLFDFLEPSEPAEVASLFTSHSFPFTRTYWRGLSLLQDNTHPPWDLLPPPLLARKTITKVNPAQDMLILIKKKREHAKTELQSLENTSQREPRDYALNWILWTLTQGRQKIKLKEGVFRQLWQDKGFNRGPVEDFGRLCNPDRTAPRSMEKWCPRGCKLCWPNPACALFLCSPQAKNVFSIFKGL